MPFALIVLGILFIIIGYRGTEAEFFSTLKGDFTGPNNFLYWIVSIGIIGAVGYIPSLKSVSNAFLALVLLVLFITKGKGFFDQFNSAISTSGTHSTGTP